MSDHEQLVYLLHFVDPETGESARYRHAGHYRGTTDDLPKRLQAHRDGAGARLMQVIKEAGLGFVLARTWPGGRDRERQLKREGGAARMCPECGVKPMPPQAAQPHLSLYELERLGTTSDGTPLPGVTTNPGTENEMFGREKRAVQRAEAARQAEADALFAEADRWADLAGEPPDFRQEITRERAARIREQLGEALAQDARAAAEEPALSGAERDAEIDRLTELFPEPAASRTLAPVAATLPDGTPHADPFLAGRGWQAQGGIYVRQPQTQMEAT